MSDAPVTSRPVLMSAENPTGWKLEELLPALRAELQAKNTWIESDMSRPARDAWGNNLSIISLLDKAEILQRDTVRCLAAMTLGECQPGSGSSGRPAPDPARA